MGGGGGAPRVAAAGAGSAAAAAPVKEKEAFDLKLTEVDAKAKIKIIKEVRAITGLGLKEVCHMCQQYTLQHMFVHNCALNSFVLGIIRRRKWWRTHL